MKLCEVVVSLEMLAVVAWAYVYIPLVFPLNLTLSLIFSTALCLPILVLVGLNFSTHVRAHEIFLRRVSGLSPLYVFFYLINAFLALFLLVLPLSAPVLLLVMSLYAPYKLASRLGRAELPLFLCLAIPLVAIAMLVFVYVYSRLLAGLLVVLVILLLRLAPYVYALSVCLAAAVSVGSFIKFIYEGARVVDPSITIPQAEIVLLEICLSASFIAGVVLGYLPVQVVSMLLVLCVVEALLRWWRGLRKPRTGSLAIAVTILTLEALRRIPEVVRALVSFAHVLVPRELAVLARLLAMLDSVFMLVATAVVLVVYFISYLEVSGGRRG